MWKKLKENNFDKDIIYDVVNSNKINEQEIYNNNCCKYTEQEIDIIKQRLDINSLLYFENTEERVREYLNKYEKDKTENLKRQEKFFEPNNESIEWKNIDFSHDKTSIVKHSKENAKSKRTSHSSIERALTDIKKGKSIEQIAMRLLNDSEKYSDVKDVSDLGLGYDLECREIRTNRTLYIEVKSFEKDYFELTENEYNVCKNNKEIYKIFLINLNAGSNNLENLIGIEELEKYFSIETSKYKCKRK